MPWEGGAAGGQCAPHRGLSTRQLLDCTACRAENSGTREMCTLLAKTEVKFQGSRIYYLPPFEDQDKNQAIPLYSNSSFTRHVHQNHPGRFKK